MAISTSSHRRDRNARRFAGTEGPATAPPRAKRDFFGIVANWTTKVSGGRWGFIFAVSVVLIWAALGPIYHFSEVWQLVINTGTTIVTFLMVFLIQNAQNRESKAVHLKLDELIFAVKNARNEMIDVERLTEDQLDRLAARYTLEAAKHRPDLERQLEVVGSQVGEVHEDVEKVEQRVDDVERKVDSLKSDCLDRSS